MSKFSRIGREANPRAADQAVAGVGGAAAGIPRPGEEGRLVLAAGVLRALNSCAGCLVALACMQRARTGGSARGGARALPWKLNVRGGATESAHGMQTPWATPAAEGLKTRRVRRSGGGTLQRNLMRPPRHSGRMPGAEVEGAGQRVYKCPWTEHGAECASRLPPSPEAVNQDAARAYREGIQESGQRALGRPVSKGARGSLARWGRSTRRSGASELDRQEDGEIAPQGIKSIIGEEGFRKMKDDPAASNRSGSQNDERDGAGREEAAFGSAD
ncbi:hypothetical protein FB451DRAFT_1164945 [Mycena latifolia]|nr:hypothetical protein FB451DRAFT_1164945 [Mycena latifolia]